MTHEFWLWVATAAYGAHILEEFVLNACRHHGHAPLDGQYDSTAQATGSAPVVPDANCMASCSNGLAIRHVCQTKTAKNSILPAMSAVALSAALAVHLLVARVRE